MTLTHDLCLAWNWEYDADFVALLDEACRAHGRPLLQVTPSTLEQALAELADGNVGCRYYLDRSSEDDAKFLRLAALCRMKGAVSINDHEDARRSWDKALMHEALSPLVRTPRTIVLPPFADVSELPLVDLAPLGPRFNIKPAHGGGGEGVVIKASSFAEVASARRQHPADKYLLQSYVEPAPAGTRHAWFRVIYCAGEVFPCWWDTLSHIYTPVSVADDEHFRLGELGRIAMRVAGVSRLGLFSSEIALTEEGTFVLIDYANDPIDLRLQSRCREGVPDHIVRRIATRLASVAAAP